MTRRRWLFAGAALVTIWLGAAALSLRAASAHARVGRAIVQTVLDDRSAEALSSGRIEAALAGAGRHFDAARRDATSPILWLAEPVPILGRQIRVVASLARAAARTTNAARRLAGSAREILALPHHTGADRVMLLGRLADAADETSSSVAHLDLGPARGLIGPVAEARAELRDKLDRFRGSVRALATGSRALAGVLHGPRRYLLLGANNSEMRAGSGMFLSVGEIAMRDGRIFGGSLHPESDVKIPRGTIGVPAQMQRLWGWAGIATGWTNLMFSPRFEASAELAARMWKAAGRGAVDGALALDPVALRAVLDATGPVRAGGREISASNVEAELLHDQYKQFGTANASALRRRALDEVARLALAKLDAGGWDPGRLAMGLGAAAAGRHLMLWSRDPVAERAWHEAGVDGSVPGDALLVSVLNRGGNKLDHFLKIDAGLSVGAANGVRALTLTLDLRNETPPGEPPYVAGPYPHLGTKAGDYLGIIAVSLPGQAGNISIDGSPVLGVSGPDGDSYVIGYQVKIARGARHRMVLRFRLPEDIGLRVWPSARIPAVAWRSGEDTWTDSSAREIFAGF